MVYKIKYDKEFDKIHPSSIHEYTYKLIKPFLFKSCKLLDIGCWVGNFQVLLKNKDIKSCAVDIDEEIIRVAQNNFPNMEFKVGDTLKLPYPDNYFDIVTLWAVLEHISVNTEKEALKEIKRVLKPNGLLFFSVPNGSLSSIVFDGLQVIFAGHRHYSVEKIDELLKDSRFKIEKYYKKGGFYEAIYWLGAIVIKRTFKKPIFETKFGFWINKKVEEEFNKNGYVELFIQARLDEK